MLASFKSTIVLPRLLREKKCHLCSSGQGSKPPRRASIPTISTFLCCYVRVHDFQRKKKNEPRGRRPSSILHASTGAGAGAEVTQPVLRKSGIAVVAMSAPELPVLPDMNSGPRNFITTEQDHGGIALTICTLMATWVVLCFGVRIYMRATVSGPFGIDDIIFTAATVCRAMFFSCPLSLFSSFVSHSESAQNGKRGES